MEQESILLLEKELEEADLKIKEKRLKEYNHEDDYIIKDEGSLGDDYIFKDGENLLIFSKPLKNEMFTCQVENEKIKENRLKEGKHEDDYIFKDEGSLGDDYIFKDGENLLILSKPLKNKILAELSSFKTKEYELNEIYPDDFQESKHGSVLHKTEENKITIHNIPDEPEEIYPDKIKVEGLPFFLKGWNRVFYKTDEYSEGKPVYRLDPYMLYYIISIIGVSLIFKNGKWQIIRDDGGIMFTKKCNKLLFGEWGFYGMNVSSI